MGIRSLFSSDKNTNKARSVNSSALGEYLDKDFYLNIVNNSHSMILYFIDGAGWIGSNQRFLDVMGYNDIDMFREQNESVRELFLDEFEEIFTESDKSWLDYIRKHQKGGYRVSIASKDGSVMTINAVAHKSPKNPKLYILEFEDVSKVYESELKIHEVEQLKQKFLSNIGHEFRTPMNSILGFIDLLDKTQLSQSQQGYLSLINRSSKNLMINVETLLDLSQLQAGRLTLELSEFNFISIVEELLMGIYFGANEKGIKVITFIDPKIPKILLGDPKKISQILYSLVDNAVKYTEKGSRVNIEIKLLQRLNNGECSLGFTLKDKGQGISSEQITILNESFTPTNQADERLSVGLSLSYGLVNLLNSELKIQSQVDGTTVHFVLDFKESKEQSFEQIPKKKVKVLLLDNKLLDEANLLTVYLRSFGLDVVKSNMLDEHIYDGIDSLYILADQNQVSWIDEFTTYIKHAPIILVLATGQDVATKLEHKINYTIKLPLHPSVIAEQLYSIYHLENIKEESAIDIKSRAHALVVEDNIINQKLIKILLETYNIKVSTASDGDEAVNQSTQNKYDIIFMDIDMPHKNGIVATHEIKESFGQNIKTPIVALTAMAMEGDKEMLLAEGLDDYLSKPLTKWKLEGILSKYL